MAESRNTQDDQEVRATRRSGGDVNADEVGTRTKVDMFVDEADQLCYGDATPVYSKDEADQLLNDKADKVDVYTKSEADQLLDDKAGKADTYTKDGVDGLLNNKADKINTYTKSGVDGLLNGKADKADTYTKGNVDGLLDNKADKVDTYTKSNVDGLLNGKADKTNTYTKSNVDGLLDNKADKVDTYTKGDVDGLLDDKSDKVDTYTKGDVDGLLDQFDQSNVVDQKITAAIDEATALEFTAGVQMMHSYDLNVDRAGELIQQLRRRLAVQNVQVERLTAALLQLREIVDAATGMNAFEYDEQGRLRPRPMPVEGE